MGGKDGGLEYLGFDPSTSSLLRTHASDCANTPVASLLEYLGFDPSTSCLRSTHASDCANTPMVAPSRGGNPPAKHTRAGQKANSVTGNRTPGICVTGRDVTNYTMTDEPGRCSSCMEVRMRFAAVCLCAATHSWFGHIRVNTAHPIRTANLSTLELDQYCSGGPCGNLEC